MGTFRVLVLAAAAAALHVPIHAQTAPALAGTYLGVAAGRAEACSPTALFCDSRTASLYAGLPVGRSWGAEIGYTDLGRLWRNGTDGRAQGLNVSLVGRARIAQGLGIYGKVGTTYGRVDTNVLGAGDPAFGLSFGGGVSYDITPQLSATLEWDAHDLRFQGVREPVRSTNLGLQLRY